MNTPEWYEVVLFIAAIIGMLYLMKYIPGIYGGKKKKW